MKSKKFNEIEKYFETIQNPNNFTFKKIIDGYLKVKNFKEAEKYLKIMKEKISNAFFFHFKHGQRWDLTKIGNSKWCSEIYMDEYGIEFVADYWYRLW